MTEFASALLDPDLGSTPFQVVRPAVRVSQGTTERTFQVFSASGCVHPGTPDMLKLLPEEERHETFIVIYTTFPLSLGENSGGTSYTAADRIAWDGKTWKLVSLQDWKPFGFCRAAAVRMDGEMQS